MKDVRNPKWIKVKGLLFLVLGLLSAALLVAQNPDAKIIALLVLAIWSFCRFYYFAFYVIERYVDPTQKFSGLAAFVRYLVSRRRTTA